MSWKPVAVAAAVAAAGTVVLGWWFVVLAGAGLGAWRGPSGRAGVEAAVGAALGWAALLGWAGLEGPVWLVAQRVGPIFHLPAVGFVVLTLGYGAALGASAALVAAAAKQWAAG